MAWAPYSADLKVNKMLIKRPLPSLRFEIPILPPLRFDPGGRPPPRVELQLQKDTDAFIVDKVVLPLEPFTELGDPRQRRVYYIIAWPDLRAARPVVDATKVLDYVSPRELEEWEYRDLLRRVKVEEDAEAEAAAALKKVSVAGAAIPGEKKKPGRKPKNAMRAQIRPPTPELDSEEEQILARKKQGPSLSTPQKSRVLRLESELDMLDSEEASVGDADVDIQLQLATEAANRDFGDVFDEEDEPMLLPEAKDATYSSGPSSPPSRAGSRPLIPSSVHRDSSSVKASPTPPVSQLKPKPKPLQAPLATSKKPISSTPVPLPFQLPFSPQREGSPSVQKAKILPNTVPPARIIARSNPSSSRPLLVNGTTQSGTASPHTPTPESSGGFVPANSFTPLGGHFPRPLKRPAEDSLDSGQSPEVIPAATRPKKERKKKQPKLSQTPAGAEAQDGVLHSVEPEPEYVVKRLEGDQIVDDVHYFQVRWEGDWPPDQNPTWEPQDNISSALVKKYLKRKADREAAKPKTHKTPKNKAGQGGKQQQTLAHWARKYASVSEAFEGKAELDHTPSLSNGMENGEAEAVAGSLQAYDDDDDPDAMDELLVVDDSQGQDRGETAAEKARRLSVQVAAQFASLTPGRRTQF